MKLSHDVVPFSDVGSSRQDGRLSEAERWMGSLLGIDALVSILMKILKLFTRFYFTYIFLKSFFDLFRWILSMSLGFLKASLSKSLARMLTPPVGDDSNTVKAVTSCCHVLYYPWLCCMLLGDSPVDYVKTIARFSRLRLPVSLTSCWQDFLLSTSFHSEWCKLLANHLLKEESLWGACNGDSAAVNRQQLGRILVNIQVPQVLNQHLLF